MLFHGHADFLGHPLVGLVDGGKPAGAGLRFALGPDLAGLVLFEPQRVDEVEAFIGSNGRGATLGQLVGLGHVHNTHLIGSSARVRLTESDDELTAVIIIVEALVFLVAHQLDFLDIEPLSIEHHFRLRVEMRAQRENSRAQQVLLLVIEAHVQLGVEHIGKNGGGGLHRGIRWQPRGHHNAGCSGHRNSRCCGLFVHRSLGRVLTGGGGPYLSNGH